MRDHACVKRRVEHSLEEFVRAEALLLEEIDASLTPVVDQARQALATGKRLRPAFCYWGWRASGQPDCEEAVRAAAAIELVHAAAVVHDDIIDSSQTRHGAPTAHVALRDRVADPQRRHFAGISLAILVGDLLIAWAGQMFASCGLPGGYLTRARPLWSTLARELIAGEMLETLNCGRYTVVDRSLEIVRLKAGKYTVERPLHIGGVLGGARSTAMTAFSDYGLPLGEAFQLRDDLLGVFGDPDTTGKSNEDDLRGRKPTVLLAVTRTLADPAEREKLDLLLRGGDLAPETVWQVRDIIEESGARRRVEQMIDQRLTTTLSALDQARFPSDSTDALRNLALEATTRAN